MAREPVDYRDQLERLTALYPGREILNLAEVCTMLRCSRQTLLADKLFPAKRVGSKGKYCISIVRLAKWLCSS
jgi:hypothetical protein